MMSKKRKLLVTIGAIALTVALIIGVTAIAAGSYGTSTDPLVSLSYLTETLTPTLKSQFQTLLDNSRTSLTSYIDSQIAAVKNQLGGSGAAADSYKVVTLSSGQTITGQVGCEFILRIGSAKCAASSSPGLVNTTTGGSIEDGAALEKNNVYIVSINGNGITASASTVKVLVRGSYTIG